MLTFIPIKISWTILMRISVWRADSLRDGSSSRLLRHDLGDDLMMFASRAVEMVPLGNNCRSISDGEVTCSG